MDDFTAKSKKVVKEMLNFTGKKRQKHGFRREIRVSGKRQPLLSYKFGAPPVHNRKGYKGKIEVRVSVFFIGF
jgi:hypothetical protein